MKNTKLSTGKVVGIVLGVILAIVLTIALMFSGKYNSLVTKDEQVTNAYANIQTNLQYRFDKINELMPSVQGFMDHESETYQKITALRSNIPGVNIDKEGNMTIKNDLSQHELEALDSATTSLVKELKIAVEAYPDLKSELMTTFMDEVAGAENRIVVSRRDYNEAVTSYNTYLRKFPTNLFAGIFGFETKEKYEADENAQNAPTIEFNK